MALSIYVVQDSRVALGPELWQQNFLLAPGTSDYVTGGYVVTAANVGFKLIQAVDVLNTNTTGLTWIAQALFTFSTMSVTDHGITNTVGVSGYSSFNLWMGTAIGTQANSSANLSGAIWQVMIYGY